MTDVSMDGVEQLPLRKFTEDAYLNYSMYVIMDRALPFIGDGLKPAVVFMGSWESTEDDLKSSKSYKRLF
jgi:topoisomerase IV subunit A